MSKKYYWIIDGKYYEVSKETYQKYKKDHDHSKRLQKFEQEVCVISLDAMVAEDITGHDVIADPTEDIEEKAIHNLMLENLRKARKELPADEQLLLTLLYEGGQTMGEIGKTMGMSQQAISKKHSKVIAKLKKILKI